MTHVLEGNGICQMAPKQVGTRGCLEWIYMLIFKDY